MERENRKVPPWLHGQGGHSRAKRGTEQGLIVPRENEAGREGCRLSKWNHGFFWGDKMFWS